MVFISGGGNYRQSAQLDELFFRMSKNILYIPGGLKRNFSGYEECWKWFGTVCREHNFNTSNVDMYLFLDAIKDLNIYDGIYIGGASDMDWLYNIFVNSGVADKLQSYFSMGGNIYGGSAGGILLGQSLDLQKKNALKLLPFSILSHYSGNNTEIESYFANNTHPIVILHEDSGIVYHDKTITSVGLNPALVFFSLTEYVTLDNNITIEI